MRAVIVLHGARLRDFFRYGSRVELADEGLVEVEGVVDGVQGKRSRAVVAAATAG